MESLPGHQHSWEPQALEGEHLTAQTHLGSSFLQGTHAHPIPCPKHTGQDRSWEGYIRLSSTGKEPSKCRRNNAPSISLLINATQPCPHSSWPFSVTLAYIKGCTTEVSRWQGLRCSSALVPESVGTLSDSAICRFCDFAHIAPLLSVCASPPCSANGVITAATLGLLFEDGAGAVQLMVICVAHI